MSKKDTTLEDTKAQLENHESWARIKRIYPNISFNEEILANLELGDHITQACSSRVNSVEDPIKTNPNAP
jgi:hypothetical protein